MTNNLFISTILLFTLSSCNNTQTQDKPKQETPNALEKNVSYELSSSLRYDDLVENLYHELLNKNIDLKKLEENIDDLNKSKGDSTKIFDKFNKNNQAYHNAANIHIADIKDSLLRDKMRNQISSNLIKYNKSIINHNNLLKIIETNNLSINDLHIILKIVKTLSLIEKYQHDNLPNTKSLEGYIKQQEETIKFLEKHNSK